MSKDHQLLGAAIEFADIRQKQWQAHAEGRTADCVDELYEEEVEGAKEMADLAEQTYNRLDDLQKQFAPEGQVFKLGISLSSQKITEPGSHSVLDPDFDNLYEAKGYATAFGELSGRKTVEIRLCYRGVWFFLGDLVAVVEHVPRDPVKLAKSSIL